MSDDLLPLESDDEVMIQDMVERLANVPLFEAMATEDLQFLADLMPSFLINKPKNAIYTLWCVGIWKCGLTQMRLVRTAWRIVLPHCLPMKSLANSRWLMVACVRHGYKPAKMA